MRTELAKYILTNKDTVSFILSRQTCNLLIGSGMLQLPKTLPSVKLTSNMLPVSKPIKAFWLHSRVCHQMQHVGNEFGIWDDFGKAVISVKDHLQSIFCFLSTMESAGIIYSELSRPKEEENNQLKNIKTFFMYVINYFYTYSTASRLAHIKKKMTYKLLITRWLLGQSKQLECFCYCQKSKGSVSVLVIIPHNNNIVLFHYH